MPTPPILFGRRLTLRATIFQARDRQGRPLGRLLPGVAKPKGSKTAIRAYMVACNTDAKARKVRLDHRQTVAECISYFAPGTCPRYWATKAFAEQVTEKHMGRPPKRPPRAKNARRHIGL